MRLIAFELHFEHASSPNIFLNISFKYIVTHEPPGSWLIRAIFQTQ